MGGIKGPVGGILQHTVVLGIKLVNGNTGDDNVFVLPSWLLLLRVWFKAVYLSNYSPLKRLRPVCVCVYVRENVISSAWYRGSWQDPLLFVSLRCGG